MLPHKCAGYFLATGALAGEKGKTMETIYIIILVGGGALLLAAIAYGMSRNKGADSPADIARTEAAARQAREQTDREETD
ncbi:hypothetical protein [Parasphingopyxis sp.]|uniref:hypothetical protein n=2 Tax=Parasphingopyxis TaxID=1234545 RepID=UPI0032ED4FAF